MKYLKQFFHYLEPIWCGDDGRPSVKRVLALYFSYVLGSNTQYAIRKWGEGKSLSDLALVLGIVAGVIMGLLGITAYYNYMQSKLSSNQNTDNKIPSE